jgi:DME family drug/metabolite transporter
MSKEHWFIVIAAILYGAITAGGWFFIDAGFSIFEISLYRVLFINLVLLPIALIRRGYMVKKETLSFFVFYGLIGASLELAQFGGIALGVPVAIVVLLLYSQPIWTIAFARLMLEEPITSRKTIAAFIALLGVVFLLRSWEIRSLDSTLGIASSLLGGVLLSLWITLGRKSGISNQHYLTTTIGWSGFSVIWLLLLWPVAALFIHEPSLIRLSIDSLPAYWFHLAVFGSVAGVIPHLLFYRGIQNIQASTAGIVLLLEPVSATTLAAILFGQTVGLNVLCGGALILFSNYLIIHKPS